MKDKIVYCKKHDYYYYMIRESCMYCDNETSGNVGDREK